MSALIGALASPGLAHANGIVSASYDGAGCPAHSAGLSIASDGRAMTLIFDRFVASVGSGVQESEGTKDCIIGVTMASNEDAVLLMDTRGYVQLPSNVSAQQQQHVPRAKRANTVKTFGGPVSKDYVTQSSATVLMIGNPSSTKFVIMLRLELDNSADPALHGQITTDSLDLSFQP